MVSILTLGASLITLSILCDGTWAITNGQKNKRRNLYTVWIEYERGLVCGGSLISDRWVLTAARCIQDDNLKSYRIVIGDLYPKKKTDGQVYAKVDKFVLHPSYTPGEQDNDIALILLKDVVDVNLNNVAVAKYTGDSLDNVRDNDRSCEFSSYGDVDVNVTAKYRQKLTVLLEDDVNCEGREAEYTDANICFRAKKYRTRSPNQACRGDEGSPIVCKVGGKNRQVGINLEGSCENEYNVGLSLEQYQGWIDATVSGQGLAGEVSEEYPNSAILRPSIYQLWWRANATALVFEVHVATLGWVGFGISQAGKMWPGDTSVGYVADDGSCVLEVHVDTLGWIGFSISQAGKMWPGDTSVGYVADDGSCVLKDRVNVAYQKPTLDTEQNVELLACRQTDTATMLKFARPINSTDLAQDIWFQPDGNHVIFAYGTSDTLSYHFSNKGSEFIQLL